MRVSSIAWSLLLTSSCLFKAVSSESGLSTIEVGGQNDVCCSLITSSFKTRVSYPKGPTAAEYNTLSKAHWSSTTWLLPKCIFSPQSAQQVAVAVKIFKDLKCTFATRSGGHSTNAGWANTKGGILMSLSEMNQTIVENEIAKVGPGARWGDVYDVLTPKKLAVVGGRLAHVGVGGLILGGGLSFLSTASGLACDNVKNFEVVLANGTIVSANAQINPELFQSLKGGGNNFGIVTRFDLLTHPLDKIWGGEILVAEDKFPAVLSALKEYQEAGEGEDTDSSIIISFATFPAMGAFANMVLFYRKPVENPKVLEMLTKIPSLQNSMEMRTLASLTKLADSRTNYNGARIIMRTISIGDSLEVYNYAVKTFMQAWANPEGTAVPGLQPNLSFQPIPSSLIKAGNKNSLGLDANKAPYAWIVMTINWDLAADDAKVLSTAKKITEDVKRFAKSVGMYSGYLFMNDAAEDQEVIAGYGAENIARMMRVKANYDPENVFGSLARGGFKLPAY